MFRKRIAKIGATTAVMVMAVAGFAVISPGTASANDACEDFIRMMIIYDEMGDRATADAIWDNLQRDGCV